MAAGTAISLTHKYEASPFSWTAHREAPSAATETVLIHRALQGRNEAFADLVQPYLEPLSRFARKRLQSDIEAEDVVQESVLHALAHLAQFRGDASFKTWLTAIVWNEVLQSIKRRSTRHVRFLDQYAASNLEDPTISPHTRHEHGESVERLYQALTRLPEKYRLIIQLRDLRELSIAETARSLSLSSAAVRVRHHRARKLLKRFLFAAQDMHGSIPKLRRGNSNESHHET